MKQPVAALILSSVLLTACVGGAGLGDASVRPVLQGTLKIAAPTGYCLDGSASRESEDRAIYLMGRCDGRTGIAPALITLSIGQAGSAGVMSAGGSQLASFFTSPEGRATLSPRGRASDVKVVAALSAGEAFLMRLQEAGQPSYWRAVFGVRSRLVTVSVKGAAEVALPAEEGREILDMAVKALRRANSG